ncbi:hypothetical protein [Limosilactobacillus walteri]|uniref:Uncharacterized protein n=1 Tax=Limosilactobacillus walteri TaxID=2268022 RepID=A0ABR8P818_9LACO|nr:hypothetical protein [Limosilactobacillus walteri]MBD5806883.1 hypothetical protein [Limosilactobacillus walteri]
MAFEVPHKHDISLDGQEMRNQMIENFKAIEQEDHNDHQALSEEIADRKKGDEGLQGEINKINDSLKNKATFDDLTETKNELQQRINHLYAGDPRTIKTVVKEILEEKGVI